MLHPDTELRKVNDEIGYGVFATRPIPKGTITWALDPLDQLLDARQTESLYSQFGNLLITYTWLNARGKRILCWDFARFMNHSCEANSFSPGGFDFEIAVCDIPAGAQITSDYGALNLDDPFDCRCGSLACRGVVKPEDFELWAADWDEQIRAAFPGVRAVDQPLWKWVSRHQKLIERYVGRPEMLPSVLKHRWHPTRLAVASERRRSSL